MFTRHLIKSLCRITATKKRRAFSLIEVMAASVILTVSITGTLTLSSQGLILMEDVRNYSRASQILQQKMEDIRMMPFSDIQALPSTFSDPKDTAMRFSGTIIKQTYRTDLSGRVQALKVTLKVTWASKGDRTNTQTLTTVFTNGGLNVYIF